MGVHWFRQLLRKRMGQAIQRSSDQRAEVELPQLGMRRCDTNALGATTWHRGNKYWILEFIESYKAGLYTRGL